MLVVIGTEFFQSFSNPEVQVPSLAGKQGHIHCFPRQGMSESKSDGQFFDNQLGGNQFFKILQQRGFIETG